MRSAGRMLVDGNHLLYDPSHFVPSMSFSMPHALIYPRPLVAGEFVSVLTHESRIGFTHFVTWLRPYQPMFVRGNSEDIQFRDNRSYRCQLPCIHGEHTNVETGVPCPCQERNGLKCTLPRCRNRMKLQDIRHRHHDPYTVGKNAGIWLSRYFDLSCALSRSRRPHRWRLLRPLLIERLQWTGSTDVDNHETRRYEGHK